MDKQTQQQVEKLFENISLPPEGMLGNLGCEAVMSKPKDPTISYRSWIEGPKFAGLKTFLKTGAFIYELEIEIESDRGWFTEMVRYEVKGPRSKVLEFERSIKESIEAHNGGSNE